MSRVFVSGLGAVSPAGWGVPALRAALQTGQPLPIRPIERPGWDKPSSRAWCPTPRRARPSSLTRGFAAPAPLRITWPPPLWKPSATPHRTQRTRAGSGSSSACSRAACNIPTASTRKCSKPPPPPARCCSRRPSLPRLPAMWPHCWANFPLVHTLVGDPAVFLQGVALVADWLIAGRIDVGLVVGAEEANWLRADAIWHFDHACVSSAGAGCVA